MVKIAGIASTNFGKHPDMSTRDLFVKAAMSSVDDAMIDIDAVEEMYVGNFIGDITDDQAHVGALMADYLGVPEAASMRVESACASASAAARMGKHAIESKNTDVVLVGGVEKMFASGIEEVTDALANAADHEYENQVGLTFPGIYAIIARVYMEKYDVTESDLGHIALKNRRFGVSNPISQFKDEIDIEEVLESPTIASPLKLLDCCPITDGASAAIIVSDRYAKEHGLDAPVSFLGSGQSSDTIALQDRPDLTRMQAAERAAESAYSRAGLGPHDVDVCEVHDCFTIAEAIATEALGFFDHGTGIRAAIEGDTNLAGSFPTNTSGGLLAKGHPVGATGVAQLVEITKQLEDRHPNQVEDATIGLTHTVGGSGASCVVNIFGRA